MRTEFQCIASGCRGCVVCDRDSYTKEQLEAFRKFEDQLEYLMELEKQKRPCSD